MVATDPPTRPYAAEPLRCEPTALAARSARQYVRTVLRSLGRDELVDSAMLGVSELVTNACLHARTQIVVGIATDPEGVRIDVIDGSSVLPTARRGSPTSTTGRGLRMLEAVGHWGVVATVPAGKTVWFRPSAEPQMLFEVDL